MAKNRNSKKYQSQRERVKKQAQEREKTGVSKKYNLPSGVENYSPEKGNVKLGVVPYEVTVDDNPDVEKGQLGYKRKVGAHYNVGIENESIICPKTIGKRCPICEKRAKLMKDWDENEDEIKLLRPSDREIFNLINMDEDEDELLFKEFAYANFGELLEDEIDAAENDDPILGISDLTDRPVLKVRWKFDSYGGGKPYLVASKITAVSGNDLDPDILKKVVNLDECLNVLSYDDLEALFLEIEKDPKESSMGDDVPIHDEKEEEKEDKKEDKKKKRERQRANKKKEKEADNPCPHDLTFGVPLDNNESCDDCDIWDKCMDEQERLEEAKEE